MSSVKMVAFITQHMKDGTKRVTIKMRIPEDHEYVAVMPVHSRKSVSLVHMRYLPIREREVFVKLPGAKIHVLKKRRRK